MLFHHPNLIKVFPAKPNDTIPTNKENNLPLNPPSNWALNMNCQGMTQNETEIILHCTYTASWQVKNTLASNLQVELNQASYNYPIKNVTDNTFDIIIPASSYSNSTSSVQYLETCYSINTSTFGTWTALVPTFTQTNVLTTPQGKITVQASTTNNQIIITSN